MERRISRTQALGRAGEDAAARHLEERGYHVLERNARAGGVEIDLVVERTGTLVFVEVKTRSSRRTGRPEEAVDARKQQRLTRGAIAWIRSRRVRRRRIRFDVVACETTDGGAEPGFRIRHFEGAFDASSEQ